MVASRPSGWGTPSAPAMGEPAPGPNRPWPSYQNPSQPGQAGASRGTMFGDRQPNPTDRQGGSTQEYRPMSRPADPGPGFRTDPQSNYAPGAVTGYGATPSGLADPYRPGAMNSPRAGPYQATPGRDPAAGYRDPGPYPSGVPQNPTMSAGYQYPQNSGQTNMAAPATYQRIAPSTGQPSGYPAAGPGGSYPAGGYPGGYATGYQGVPPAAGYAAPGADARVPSGPAPGAGYPAPTAEPGTAQFQGGLDRSTTGTYDRAGSSIR